MATPGSLRASSITKYYLGLKSAKELKAEYDKAFPRQKPKQATSLAVVKAKDAKAATKPDDTKVKDSKPDDAKPTDAAAVSVNPNNFTLDQDATILKMKGESKTWKEIGEAVDKSKGEVQSRFKELNKIGAAAGTKEESKAEGGDEDKKKEGATAKDSAKKVLVVAADEKFSVDDLNILTKLLYADQEQLWERLASKFYDETDKLVDPESIRKKLTAGS